jgi:hypothetical protein
MTSYKAPTYRTFASSSSSSSSSDDEYYPGDTMDSMNEITYPQPQVGSTQNLNAEIFWAPLLK